ncbi:LEAF RUST 10 DISEASE-RESISTANCE LOCUS RECEPTOR-LIKE PROTEIN KINASE-like 1.2 isoform X4 [Hordeum vulgare subsp. vulgare]|uniref:LEAF RUST 10 DISEASE-RESISTANCE LOCUS RECEPTOR-LIKE PROTEIN KINASE-like 1.2 isoform X4 n=1 Tax=Hordeum vulgare subsp. vulgare TaxID=112509 RepID=UPI001D1A44FC|nr:LEAF RUST 10 DISEASE-RESISTANCE LOCUS RECEPTOR-LIKE PROTEIN KINASE-like 1.2 isoform X4 [Hordeum vulgare subsp. vulgare]
MVLPWLGSCLHLLLLAATASAMLAAAADVGGCTPGKCGDLTVSIPFGLVSGSEENQCAQLGFQVHCIDHVPYLGYYERDVGLRILDIFVHNGSLLVSDVHKLGDFDLSGDGSRCHVPTANTATKVAHPFSISPLNQNLVFYNCTKPLAPRTARRAGLVDTACRNNTFVRAGGWYNESGGIGGGYDLEGCSAMAVTVLGATTGEVNASDYQQLISGGFLLTWQPPPTADGSGNRNPARLKTIAGVVGGIGAILFMFVVCFVYFAWYKRKKRKQAIASKEFMRSGSSTTSYSKDLELDSSPHIFTFEELEVATDGFSASRELGDGGFGTVYKGKLKDGRVVAVKRLYKNNYRRVEQFLNEVDILSRLLHQNLVILYGCTSRMSRDLLLVYEFIANGTVADHLHGCRAAERGLTWPLRLNIAIETAEALAYLHAVEIIHRDVKTTNILLDNSFHVKVADFGLSRLFPLEVTHVSTVPQGTPGYVDPVYHQCYKLTDKSDVYSFGVVLVELISSKPAVDMSRSHSEINLANMALNRIQNHEVVQLVDPELGYDTDPETKRTIDRVAEVAFRCLQMERDLRPSIKEVVEILTCVRDGDCLSKSLKKKGSQKEDAHLLTVTDGVQFSPDTVIHRFHSQSTNHSGASNASGLSNVK